MENFWGHFIPLAFVVVILALIVPMAIHTIFGKDFWPFSAKGPFKSHEEAEWELEAYRDYAKKVPHPKAAGADADPKSA